MGDQIIGGLAYILKANTAAFESGFGRARGVATKFHGSIDGVQARLRTLSSGLVVAGGVAGLDTKRAAWAADVQRRAAIEQELADVSAQLDALTREYERHIQAARVPYEMKRGPIRARQTELRRVLNAARQAQRLLIETAPPELRDRLAVVAQESRDLAAHISRLKSDRDGADTAARTAEAAAEEYRGRRCGAPERAAELTKAARITRGRADRAAEIFAEARQRLEQLKAERVAILEKIHNPRRGD